MTPDELTDPPFESIEQLMQDLEDETPDDVGDET